MPKIQGFRIRIRGAAGHALVGLLAALLVSPASAGAWNQDPAAAPPADAAPEQAPALSMDQLKSLVAPIALYPDPLLAQCLAASTYPLDVMEAQQWLSSNSSLKGDALTEAAQKQDWDPSVQALVVLPDALKRLSEDIKWTTDLGNAFLAQENDVMDAVQLLRNEAKSAGKLDSTEQMKVETKVVESKTIVEIQPASTEIVYVPSYSPTVVWGAPVYPYPPVYYPPYVPGAALFSFGVGMAVGAAIGGGWGWGCGWGGNNTININNNNNFNRNSNVNRNVNRSGNSNWQHNAQNRGGVPYKDKATASKYGGGARGDSASARQSQAQNRQSSSLQRGSNSAQSNRSGGAGASSRAGGTGDFDRSRGSGGGGSSVGNRSVPQSNRSGGSAFGGGGGSSSGSRASASSSRGSSSMGSRGGGGHRGGGGGGGRRR